MLEVDNVIGHETERIGIHMGLGRALNPMTGVSTRKERGIWTQKPKQETHLDKVYVTRDNGWSDDAIQGAPGIARNHQKLVGGRKYLPLEPSDGVRATNNWILGF